MQEAKINRGAEAEAAGRIAQCEHGIPLYDYLGISHVCPQSGGLAATECARLSNRQVRSESSDFRASR